jgi:uncharacterized protein with HEPN domain
MTFRDDRITLLQVLDHAREAVDLASGRSDADIKGDRVLSLALIQLLQITGEAVTRIPDHLRSVYPDVAWREAVEMRNRLIHGYDTIDMGVVVRAVRYQLPKLIDQVQQILDERFPPE